MKKIVSLVLVVFLVILVVASIGVCAISGNVLEQKIIENSDIRIVEAKSISEKEQNVLDSALKQNKNVLLLYYETDKEIVPLTEKLIINKYSKEEIPYVIFVYSPTHHTLKTISSNKEILDFNDIYVENVNSYTEVYRYLGGINSKVMVSKNVQNPDSLISLGIVLAFIIMVVIIIIVTFINELKYCTKWQKREYQSYLYKENFLETGYKVKIEPQNETILAIYAKVPVVKEKDYFFIPKSDKKGLNEIVIETRSFLSYYKANKEKRLAFDCIGTEYKGNNTNYSLEEYKYCLKNKK